MRGENSICLWGQEAAVCALSHWCPAAAGQTGGSGCQPGLSPGTQNVSMLMHPQPIDHLLSGVRHCSEEHSQLSWGNKQSLSLPLECSRFLVVKALQHRGGGLVRHLEDRNSGPRLDQSFCCSQVTGFTSN